jgi:lipopolysaccharide transport system ATP-binding protein
MGATSIEVRELGKQYKLGLRAASGQTFGERLVQLASAPWRRLRMLRETRSGNDLFWALRAIDFEVRPGEVLGIIGRNGAGKSTLLKILSRVTEPTEGWARLRGRVASLLEVGTGFHPELTGRENILLNGAILGMRRTEIARKFDEIVAFAEVDQFLDTPVKRYSSGMRVRLGFAVAAHLDPEILIVDEVLAVGDAAFQKKCLGKMKTVGHAGRTVLFVSHNMTAVRNLCTRAILLDGGELCADGAPAEIVQQYLAGEVAVRPAPEMDLRQWPMRRGSGAARIVHAALRDVDRRPAGTFNRLDPMTLEFTIEGAGRAGLNLSATCVTADDGLKVLQLAHQDSPGFEPGVVAGRRTIRVEIPALPLQCGAYCWNLSLHTEALVPVDTVQEVLPFSVEDDQRRSPRPYRSTRENGLCSLPARWSFVDTEEMAHAVESA